MTRIRLLFVAVLGIIITLGGSAQTSLPIIPGAFGFGMGTRAAYGGTTAPTVYRVQNLNDSGLGSLRDALLATGPRVVIFETSGTIPLASDIVITSPYLTVAGQTAPSPGITVRNFGIDIATHDVLLWHLRIRPGDGPPLLPQTADHDANEIYGGQVGPELVYNVVIAQNSFSWAQGKNSLAGSIGTNAGVTYWRNIFSEALFYPQNVIVSTSQPSSLGLLLAQSYVGIPANMAVLQNLLAHNSDRNPEIQGLAGVVLANNVIYDWGKDGDTTTHPGSAIYPWGTLIYQTGDVTGPTVDVIGNQYIAGVPHQLDSRPMPFTPLYATAAAGGTAGVQIYLSDNAVDQTQQTVVPFVFYANDPRVPTPPVSLAGMTIMASGGVKSFVLSHAGARPVDRDSVDTRIVSEVRSYTGNVITSQTQVGGWPTLAVNVVPLTLPTNPNSVTASGYTNLELWLQGYAAAVEGSVTPPPNITGTFAVAAPAPTFGVSGSVNFPGTFSFVAPAPTISVTGTVTPNGVIGVIDVTAPDPSFTTTGTVTLPPGVIDVTAPAPTFSFTGTVSTVVRPQLILGLPASNATGVAQPVSLAFTSVGLDTFDVYFGTSSNPSYVTTISSSPYSTGALTTGRRYYWRVIGHGNGKTLVSPVRSFVAGS